MRVGGTINGVADDILCCGRARISLSLAMEAGLCVTAVLSVLLKLNFRIGIVSYSSRNKPPAPGS